MPTKPATAAPASTGAEKDVAANVQQTKWNGHKIPPPPNFSRTTEELTASDWLFTVEDLTATSFLRSDALKWWQRVRGDLVRKARETDKAVSNEEEEGEKSDNDDSDDSDESDDGEDSYELLHRHKLLRWKLFRKRFKAQFEPINQNAMARDELDDLTFVGPVATLNGKFLAIAARISDLGKAEELRMYISKLHERTAAKVKDRNPPTLVQAMQLAEMFDRNWRHTQKTKKAKPSNQATSSTTTKPKNEPAGNTLAPDERQRRLKEGRCFECGVVGHRSRECPTKKGQRQ